MAPTEVMLQPATNLTPTVITTKSRHWGLRISCWAVVLTLGAVQAWITRFVMNPDGISYLDMGDAYWRADWHNAINAYWSPLYPWILGFFLKLIKPTPYWEYPVVHWVNFLIYVVSLACFEYFLVTFIAERKCRDRELTTGEHQSGLPESSWWLLGYSLFAASSLVLIGLYRVTPDLCVGGLVYLASALIIKIRSGMASREIYALLGLVLGLSYLAKAVMFPLAFVFLAVTIFLRTGTSKYLRNTAAAVLVFLAVATPLCIAISSQKGRLSFGDAGSWNYSLYVNRVAYWAIDSPALKHPLRQFSTSLPIYEFAQPVGGTFPPWYDPTYWHEGIKTYVNLKAQLQPLAKAAGVYDGVFFVLFLGASLGALVLYLASGSIRKAIRRAAQNWAIAVPAIAVLLLYSPVHVEGRFIGAQVTLLFLIAYAGVRQVQSRGRRVLTKYTVWAVAAVSMLTVVIAPQYEWPVPHTVYAYPRPVPGPIYAEAAAALRSSGVQPNERIGLVWNERWAAGAAEGAVVARLLRVKIVAEDTDADGFWKLDPLTRSNAIELLRATGIRAILTRHVPASQQQGWSRLGNTEYFAYFFPKDET